MKIMGGTLAIPIIGLAVLGCGPTITTTPDQTDEGIVAEHAYAADVVEVSFEPPQSAYKPPQTFPDGGSWGVGGLGHDEFDPGEPGDDPDGCGDDDEDDDPYGKDKQWPPW